MLIVGCFAGWYYGHTRPLVRYVNRMNIFMEDPQFATQFAKRMKEDPKPIIDAARMQEEAVVRISLTALDQIESGHPDLAKAFLARWAADYYHNHKSHSDSQTGDLLLIEIESAQFRSPTLKDAIAKKPE